MRGVVFTGEKDLEIMTFPDPTPGPDEVVLEMKASGMCGSDLHQYRRPKGVARNATGLPANPNPVIAGHEPCGVVVAVGSAVSPSQAKIGDRMMCHHYQGCTQCSHCRSGWQQLCQEVPVKVYGSNSHGGHAKYLQVQKEDNKGCARIVQNVTKVTPDLRNILQLLSSAILYRI